MELATQTVPLSNTFFRPLANYHPNVWGDHFLLHEPRPDEAFEKRVIEELKEEVKRELKEASNDYMRLLKMVDAIQRLGIEYHFEEEIDQASQNLSEKYQNYCKDNHDMYIIALTFRVLRQLGHRVSCHIFDKFEDEKGVFKVVPNNIKGVEGVLELFEATHLRIHDEQILDRGYVFSRTFLGSVLPNLHNPLAEQVRRALYERRTYWRGYTRLEAKHYVSIYEQTSPHHEGLLKLAKMDFNLLQSVHKRELSVLSRWWKGLEVPKNLPFARDRLVETYFWHVGVYFEPQYGLARKFLTKIQIVTSLIDDTFDAYGTFEELQLFADAIERWNLSCLDLLPDFMKISYKALLEVFEEIEEEMIKQGTPYKAGYTIEAMKLLVRTYLDEVKWRETKYKATMQEEYMNLGRKSSGFTLISVASFLGMGDIATREAFDWVLSEPELMRASMNISRLTEGYDQFEKERDHTPSAVECSKRELKVSEQEAIQELIKNRIESEWKDVNEALLKPTKIAVPLLYRILNLTRLHKVIYRKRDFYTHVGPEMQSFIKQLFVDPLPIS